MTFGKKEQETYKYNVSHMYVDFNTNVNTEFLFVKIENSK